MEEDRLETNLGQSSEASQEAPTEAKLSKRRFVGRKVAAERAGQQDEGTTESLGGKGAVAGGANPIFYGFLADTVQPNGLEE